MAHSKTTTIPTWEEARDAVAFGKATPLEIFIWNNEPAGTKDEQLFRQGLEELIRYEKMNLDGIF